MRKILVLLVVALCYVLPANAQNISTASWNGILNSCGLSYEQLYAACPNFPQLQQTYNGDAFKQAVQSWEANYPQEVSAFWAIDQIKKSNPSPYYLGLGNGTEPDILENSMLQWVEASGISESRMKNLAPHFPKPKQNTSAYAETYAYEMERWNHLYPHELEALVNAAELTALNPYYKEYVQINVLPKFMGACTSEEKPLVPQNAGFGEKLQAELALMDWYFIFEQESFYQVYGYIPQMPVDFNANDYRAAAIKEMTEITNSPSEQAQ